MPAEIRMKGIYSQAETAFHASRITPYPLSRAVTWKLNGGTGRIGILCLDDVSLKTRRLNEALPSPMSLP